MKHRSIISKARVWYLPALLLLFITTCSDVIDLDTDGTRPQMVIHGRVTDGSLGNEVSIAFTSSFNGRQEPVTGARVRLIENNQDIAEYLEASPGVYRLDYTDSAREGRTYQLAVELRDGRSYLSLPSVMPSLAAIDHPRVDASRTEVEVNQEGLEVERNLAQLYTDTEVIDPDKDFYLRWNIIEAYSVAERLRPSPFPPPPCYITNDITGQQARLFNGSELKVSVIPDVFLTATTIDSRFAFAYFFSVIQTTMDEAAYEYWSLIDEISNTRGSIFDRPAAPVPGNFRNTNDPEEEVLGYFEVVRSDTTRVRLNSENLPFFILAPCPFSEREREPAWCTACLLLENSSHQRPYYWY